MGEVSRLIAPVSQLKCDSRGNFSADTLLSLFRLFAETSQFRSMWPIHHIHMENLSLAADRTPLHVHLWEIPAVVKVLHLSPRTSVSFQNSLNPQRRKYSLKPWKMCLLLLEHCIQSVTACFGDTDLIHVKRRAGGLDLALQMNFTFSWPTCQLLSIPCIDTTGATGKRNNTDAKF